MTRVAEEHGAINLAQGFPDFPCPQELKIAAKRAIDLDYNQYSITWGSPELRSAICRKAKGYNKIDADPDKNVVVTCGTTEAMVATQLGLLNPGDEIVILDPHYENYEPDALISGAKTKHVELNDEHDRFNLDEEKLKAAFNSKTRGIILNTPLNPTGKVFDLSELRLIADLCNDYDSLCFADEIYEYILYDGSQHLSIGSLPSMLDRTVTISGFSKTYSVTGWRVGYAIASHPLMEGIRKVHDFVSVGAPHPLQIACVDALSLPNSYYRELRQEYDQRRMRLLKSLEEIGFRCTRPQGAYYIWSDFSEVDNKSNDVAFSKYLVEKIGVAAVPGSSFLQNPRNGKRRLRFTFSKKMKTIKAACEKLHKLVE